MLKRPVKPVWDIQLSTDASALYADLFVALKQTTEKGHISSEAKTFVNLMIDEVKKQLARSYKSPAVDLVHQSAILKTFIGGIIAALAIDDSKYVRSEAEATYPSHTWGRLVRLGLKLPEDASFETLTNAQKFSMMAELGSLHLEHNQLPFSRALLERTVNMDKKDGPVTLFPGLVKEYNKLQQLVNLSALDNSKAYIDQYKQHLKQRRINTILVVLATIFLTPLSLFISIPLWLRAKRAESIIKIETTPAVVAKVKAKRQAFWATLNVTEDCKNKSKPKKVIVSSNAKKVEFLADSPAVNRFHLFAGTGAVIASPEELAVSKQDSKALYERLYLAS
jgi:hypothetical protein